MIRLANPHARRKARIEIVPLIDIVFFLLATFVMVSLSMVKNQGVTVRLPEASSAAVVDRSETVTVSVSADGSFYIGKERVEPAALRARLERLKRSTPQVGIIVNGDDQADFGAAVRALDEIRKSGITRISIQTRRPAGGA
jgi:biopolymer transport protein ExbD